MHAPNFFSSCPQPSIGVISFSFFLYSSFSFRRFYNKVLSSKIKSVKCKLDSTHCIEFDRYYINCIIKINVSDIYIYIYLLRKKKRVETFYLFGAETWRRKVNIKEYRNLLWQGIQESSLTRILSLFSLWYAFSYLFIYLCTFYLIVH